MSKSIILLANGYEEVEALTVVDLFRRVDLTIDMISITGDLETVGDHGITIRADKLLNEIDSSEYDMLILPGGLPGSQQLTADEDVQQLLKDFRAADKYIAAICAAPMALERAGLLKDYCGTGYPAVCRNIYDDFCEDIVCVDRKLITAQGPAVSTYFALKLVEIMAGKEARDELAEGMLLPQVENFVCNR